MLFIFIICAIQCYFYYLRVYIFVRLSNEDYRNEGIGMRWAMNKTEKRKKKRGFFQKACIQPHLFWTRMSLHNLNYKKKHISLVQILIDYSIWQTTTKTANQHCSCHVLITENQILRFTTSWLSSYVDRKNEFFIFPQWFENNDHSSLVFLLR